MNFKKKFFYDHPFLFMKTNPISALSDIIFNPFYICVIYGVSVTNFFLLIG